MNGGVKPNFIKFFMAEYMDAAVLQFHTVGVKDL